MKEKKEEDIIKQYIKSGKIAYNSTFTGEYRKANREHAKLIKIFKYLEENIPVAKKFYLNYLITQMYKWEQKQQDIA